MMAAGSAKTILTRLGRRNVNVAPACRVRIAGKMIMTEQEMADALFPTFMDAVPSWRPGSRSNDALEIAKAVFRALDARGEKIVRGGSHIG